MAPERTVDIGSFSIASKADKDFVLAVSTSMTLSLPDYFPDNLTANELRDQVQAGALWLTRASSCRLALAVRFERPAEVSDEEGAQWRQFIIEVLPSLQVWCDVGLELLPELNDLQGGRTPSPTSVYHIQHAQQHSGLFVPKGVPYGYLSELSCTFRYGATTSAASGTAGESGLRSRANSRYNLRELVRTQVEPCHMNGAAFWLLPWDKQAEKVVDLTQNAMNRMLGLKTRCVGFLSLERTKQPALLELAPAVWNAHYFQRLVGRAKLIPAISHALGNLMSTQSLALRGKIKSLAPEAAADSGLGDILYELQRRTQVLILRSARDQKIKTSVPKASTSNDFSDNAYLDLFEENQHAQVDSQSQEALSGFAGHELMHSEFESSHGFTNFSARSPESNGINLGPEDSCMNNDMEGVEWIDDDTASYTSEHLEHYRGFYDEHCAGTETFDLPRGGREYQKQHVDTDAALQEHGTENAEIYYYYESDSCSHYSEMSDIEEVQPTAHYFEGRSAESNRAAGTLEESEDDFEDFVADEVDVDIGTYDHLFEEDSCSDGCHDDPWELNGDHEGCMLHG